MRFLLLLLLVSISSCDNSSVKRLESENLLLKSKIDSMEIEAEVNMQRAREAYKFAALQAKETLDSIIVARNLKVIRLNEVCSTEAYRDLLHSVENIEQELAGIDIEVTYLHLTDCGYEFHHGSSKKIIEGVLTELDLVKEIESFFGIKLSNREINL